MSDQPKPTTEGQSATLEENRDAMRDVLRRMKDDQPKPSEWTAGSVKALVGYDIGGSGVIARAHNAALAAAQKHPCKNGEIALDLKQQLAAEREKSDKVDKHRVEACNNYIDALAQLAAAREKVQTLVDALIWFREHVALGPTAHGVINDALAKVGK